ncbi:MAG: WG repeat-containing protein [Aureispira sp.]
MKGSFTSLRNTLVVALSLLAINTQAQLVSHQSFSEGTFVASVQTITPNKGTTSTGALIISEYQEGAALIKVDGKFGLINKQGYEICQPIYNDIRLFNNGYAAVNKNGKWTFINKQGKRLTPLRYDWVGGFNEGVAAVMVDGKWGLLNEQGLEIVETAYDAIKLDQDGKIWVQLNKTWKRYGDANNQNGSFAEL